MDLNFLTNADVALLRRLIGMMRSGQMDHLLAAGPGAPFDDGFFTDETHVVFTEDAVPARDAYTPGTAECPVYRVIDGVLEEAPRDPLTIYNLSRNQILAGQFIKVVRDKYSEAWLTDGELAESTSEAGTGTGTAVGGGGGAGSITVKESDGTPSISASTISFDGASGTQPFTVTDSGGGVALVSIAHASNTQVGIVNTTDQGFAGIKSFGWGIRLDDALATGMHIGFQGYTTSSGNTTDMAEITWLADGSTSNYLQTKVYSTDSQAAGIFSRLKPSEAFDAVARFQIGMVPFTGGSSSDFPIYSIADGSGAVHDGGSATTGGLTFKGGLYISGSASGGYTDEEAQDAVGLMLVDTDTVDLTYDDASNSIEADVRYQMSITSDASGIKLVGDSASPGNSKYYGTDSGGTKGYHSLSSGDVTGPASSTDNAVARFSGTTGKILQDSALVVEDDGVTDITVTDAVTNAISDVLHILHTSSGTTAAGFGLDIHLANELADGGNATTATIRNALVTPTGVSNFTAYLALLIADHNSASREGMRIQSNGSAALLGFLGATPVAQQTGDVGTALVNFGLMSGTPTFAYSNLTGTGFIVLEDQKTQNTEGGTFTSGAWRTRDLNTEVVDTGGDCSLSSNQFTLTAGTYEIIAVAPAALVNRHQIRLQNVTDGTTVLTGKPSISGASDNTQTDSILLGRFTIGASKALEIQHQCQTTYGTSGFGLAANFTTEVYTVVALRRVA